MDRIDGPQPLFERVIMNATDDDFYTQRMSQKQNNNDNIKQNNRNNEVTYREGDILLNYESDLKTMNNAVDMDQIIMSQKEEDQNIPKESPNSINITNNFSNLNQLSQLLPKRQEEEDVLEVQQKSNLNSISHRQKDGNISSIFSQIERNKQQTFDMSPQLKPSAEINNKKRKTLKEFRDQLIGQQNHTNSEKKPIKTQQSNNQIIDLKLVNQLRKKMVYFFNICTTEGRKKYLNNEQIRKTIGDKSDIFQLNNKSCISKFFYTIYYSIFKNGIQLKLGNKTLINPHSPASFWMKSIFTIYNSAFFIMLSIIVIYIENDSPDQIIYLVTEFIWFVEILIQLNTQIYDSYNLISDRGLIFSNYIKKRSAWDLFPYITLLSLPENMIQKIIFQSICFLKLANVYTDINEIQKKLCMLVKNYYVIQLVNLILKLLTIGHIIACLWYLIGQFELHILGAEKTWYDDGLGEMTWWVLYLESFYWSLTLMTTGSNVATTVTQMFFTTFIMLFTTILFGYMLNVTGIIISQLDQQDENKRLDLNILNEYMRNNKISKTLQARVNIDLEYYYQNNMDKVQEDKSAILKKISPHLQSLLKYEYCCQIIQEIDFVKSKFSEQTIIELSNCLIEEFYLPNQNIFKQNQYDHISLIFILQGQIEISQSNGLGSQKIPIRYVKKGEIIGQSNFFSGLAYDISGTSTEFTKVVRIERDKFIQIIQQNQKDIEIFCQLRDTVLMQDNYEVVRDQCSICKNYIHLERDCPLVHASKSQLYYKNKFFQNSTQPRGDYANRKKQIHKNTLNLQKQVNSTAQQYCKNLRHEFRGNNNQEVGGEKIFNLSYLKNNFESENSLSSDESSNESNKQSNKFVEGNSTSQKQYNQEEGKDDSSFQYTMKSSKRISNVNNGLDKNESSMQQLQAQAQQQQQLQQQQQQLFQSNTNTLTTISNNMNPPTIINNMFPTSSIPQCFSHSFSIDPENLQILMDDSKQPQQQHPLKPKASLYNRKYSQIMKQTKQFLQQFVQEEETHRKSAAPQSLSHLQTYNFEAEQKVEINNNYQGQLLDQQALNQFTMNTIDRNNQRQVTNNKSMNDRQLQNFQDEHLLMIQETTRYDNFNPWEFDSIKNYTRYFPSGNSKIILIKYLKFQRKNKNLQKKKQEINRSEIQMNFHSAMVNKHIKSNSNHKQTKQQ